MHTLTHTYTTAVSSTYPGGQMHIPSAQLSLTHPGTQVLTVGGEGIGGKELYDVSVL